MPQTHRAGVIFLPLSRLTAFGNQPNVSPETPEKKRQERKKAEWWGHERRGGVERAREKILPLFQKTEPSTALAGEAGDPDFPPGPISWVAGDTSCDLSGPQFPLCQEAVSTLSRSRGRI